MSDAEQPASGRTRRIIVGACVMIGVVACALAIGPRLLHKRMKGRYEGSSIGALRTLATAMEEFRQGAIVDQDKDGKGEYALLQELSGVTIPRGATAKVNPAYTSRVFGDSALRGGGIAEKSGYHFIVYLPTATGSSRERAGGQKPVAADADAQELRYIIYAWPMEGNVHHHRAFAINQRGVVFATENPRKYVGLKRIPPPEAALQKSGKNPKTLDAPIGGKTGETGDGQAWYSAGG